MDFKNATETQVLAMGISRDELLSFAAAIVATVARKSDLDYFRLTASTIRDEAGNLGGSFGFEALRKEAHVYSELEVESSQGLSLDSVQLALSNVAEDFRAARKPTGVEAIFIAKHAVATLAEGMQA